jgi:hypothetical protein
MNSSEKVGIPQNRRHRFAGSWARQQIDTFLDEFGMISVFAG